METKFNFNSQVATNRQQSERLLALGLKKETADMRYVRYEDDIEPCIRVMPWCEFVEPSECNFPAWSLHRLIKMIKKSDYLHYDDMGCIKLYLEQDDFDRVIAIISIMVKEEHFNKEYLV